MDKLKQALQEELANRLKAGKIKSSSDLSDIFSELFREGIQEMLKATTNLIENINRVIGKYTKTKSMLPMTRR